MIGVLELGNRRGRGTEELHPKPGHLIQRSARPGGVPPGVEILLGFVRRRSSTILQWLQHVSRRLWSEAPPAPLEEQ